MLDRRRFLQLSAAATFGGLVPRAYGTDLLAPRPPAFSVVPVVGDGRWIWTAPPEGQTGYLEPRRYRLRVGIELTGRGDAGDVYASTPVPVAAPEQEITAERTSAENGQAIVSSLTPTARQLALATPQLVKGAKAAATAEFELTISKQYFGHEADDFPAEQKIPNHVWSEFYLTDDRLRLPGKTGTIRLQTDRLRHKGVRPEARYWADLTPLAEAEGADPGPGARRKIETGEWIVSGTHELDRVARR